MFYLKLMILCYFSYQCQGSLSASKYPPNTHIPGALTTDGGCRKAKMGAGLSDSTSVVTSRVIMDPYYENPIAQYWCKIAANEANKLGDSGPFVIHCPAGYVLIVLHDVVIGRFGEQTANRTDRGYCVLEDLI